MTSERIKRSLLRSVIGLFITAATALVAVRLYAPKPPIPTANTEITHQVANTISSITEFTGGTSNANPTIKVHPNTTVSATTVRVSAFNDGQDDGYALSIPSGNSSICIWNYTGGTGAIPGSETTYARSATEKHSIYTNAFLYDWEVTCVDDFGNRYVGVFPDSL